MGETRGDYATRFKGKPEGPMGKPLSVAVPLDVDAAIRALPDRSDWMRQVITEAARRELTADGTAGAR